MNWTEEDNAWICKMDELFSNLFGPDYCLYEYTETKHCEVEPGQFPLIQYNHEKWEKEWNESNCGNTSTATAAPQHSGTTSTATTAPQHSGNTSTVKTAPQHSGNTSTAKAAPQHSGTTSSATTAPQRSGNTSTAKAAPQQNGNTSTAKAAPQHSGTTSSATTAPQHSGTTSSATTAPQHSGNTGIAKTAPQHSGNTSTATTGNASQDFGGNRELRLHNLSVLTRCERAALALPRVAPILSKDVLSQGQIEVRNPLLVHLRPPENVVQHAINLLREASTTKSGEGDDVDIEDKVAVTIGSLGTFTQESVQVFQTMCNLAKEAVKIREEEEWLAKGNDVLLDLTSVRDLLLNSRPNDEVLKQGMCIMDVSDFSTLACERYVNGFTIDTVCLKFLEESKTTNIVYLPSFSQTWAKQGPGYFSQKVKQFFTHCAVEDAKCIMTPVHFDTPQHWGLLCFDTASKTVYFDDGLKLSPPRGTRTVLKNMLGSFELLSNHVGFKEVNWNQHNLDSPLPRFNMPRQTKSGEGAASCGIGIILSVRDIIMNETCLPPLKWMYRNMSKLRKELMTLVVQWKT